ncbi:MAG: recombinase XerD [Thermobifida sp.]|nr:recombinase XerD [Thermobifida sp.]PZN59925.1 MAG: recombinase XerD [Thermobifida fusca]
MARVWIYDRQNDKRYREAAAKAKAARRTPPGRWQVRYYDPSGRLRTETFAKRSLAEQRKTELEGQLHSGIYCDPSAGKVAFGEVAELWLDSRTDLKRSTWWKYRGLLDTHLSRWRELPLTAIHTEDIAAWVAQLHRPKSDGGAGLGASQTRHAYRVLSMVLDWCVPRRLPRNPAQGVSLPRWSEAEHVYLTYEQVERLAAAAESRTTRYGVPTASAAVNGALIRLLAYTGLRWGEASALRVKHVNLEARRIRVATTFSEVKGELRTELPKTGERRTVPIPKSLVSELRPLLEGRGPDDLVFRTSRGAPLRAHNWRRREFAAAVRAAGLDGRGLTPHKLRHTAASLAIAAGADVKVLQTMLGHRSAAMTLDIYGHLFPDRLDEVADAMDARRTAILSAWES